MNESVNEKNTKEEKKDSPCNTQIEKQNRSKDMNRLVRLT